jgi:hypothetical protein
MAVKTAYTCDVCGAERKEANHWFVACQTHAGLDFHTWGWALREEMLNEERLMHLCGRLCAHKKLDQFLASVSFTTTETETEIRGQGSGVS